MKAKYNGRMEVSSVNVKMWKTWLNTNYRNRTGTANKFIMGEIMSAFIP